MSTTTRRVFLAQRPSGLPDASTWELGTTELPDPGDGEMLVKVNYISLDAAMRGWLNAVRSFLPPVQVGAMMRSLDIATVVESNHADYTVGDTVRGNFGVTEYAISDGDDVDRVVDLSTAAAPTWLGALGLPGMTAYFGLLEVGRVQPGDTVVVSAAGGSVGGLVGQIAKIRGARVIGVAGGSEKCQWIKDELGFDEAVDYRNEDVLRRLHRIARPGIDVYFDNVGGDVLDAALMNLRRGARIVVCGALSSYNAESAPPGPSRYLSLLVSRATMAGFVAFDYAERYPEAEADIISWLASGEITAHEQVAEGGVESFGEAFDLLFSGGNRGKLVLAV